MKIATLETIKQIINNIKNSFINKENIIVLTQAEYDKLETKDIETFYFIKEE